MRRISNRFFIFCIIAAVFIMTGCNFFNSHVKLNRAGAAPVFISDTAYYYYLMANWELKNADMEEAARYMLMAIEKDPDSNYLKRDLALIYFGLKNYLEAVAILEESIKSAPDDIETLTIYAKICHLAGYTQKAEETYKDIIIKSPDKEEIYILLADLYTNTNRLESAVLTYKRLIDVMPGSYKGHFYLGSIYAQLQDFDNANKHLLKSIEIAPSLEPPRYELIELYKSIAEDEKRKAGVIKNYIELLEINPKDMRAALELGLFYNENGMYDKSKILMGVIAKNPNLEREIIDALAKYFFQEERYIQAILVLKDITESAPKNNGFRYMLGIAFDGAGDTKQAIYNLKMVEPGTEFYENAFISVAYIYQKKGETPKAIEYMESELKRSPKNMELIFYLAMLWEDAGNLKEAENILKKGVQIEPDNIRLHFRLGIVYEKADKSEKCIDAMKSVIALDPEHADALNYIGYTYAELGINLDEAEKLIKKAMENKPGDGYITDSLGWVYYKKGKYKEALATTKEALRLVSNDPCIFEHLGDIYIKLKDKEKAMEYYQKALDIKDTSEIKKKIQKLTN